MLPPFERGIDRGISDDDSIQRKGVVCLSGRASILALLLTIHGGFAVQPT
jgi:hypothetical protein